MRALHLFSKEKKVIRNTVLLFSYPIFFIYLADSTLSYIFPIAIENIVNSNTIMGLILSASSLVGLICDFLFPQLFKNRTWRFYLVSGILLSLLFPISLSLGTQFLLIPFFLIASFIWGIYFELLLFSEQTFVVDTDDKENFSKDWGILYFSYQLTAILGPIIGSILLLQLLLTSTLILVFIQLLALIFALILIYRFPLRGSERVAKSRIKETINILKEAKSWEVLSFRVWPVITMGISISFISAIYWTIGGLLGQSLNIGFEMDWVIVVLYNIPLLIGSYLLSRFSIKRYKKRLSQISLLLASLTLIPFILFKDNLSILLLIIFISSFFLSFTHPLNEAVYSDLLERMGKDKGYLVGLARSNSSIAFILAPILVGIVSDSTDYYTTFTIAGIFFSIVAILLLIFTPRKIKLPQRDLEELNLH